MKKIFFIMMTLTLTQLSYAARDSVAFFYAPKKVIVLINERFESGTRLRDFLAHVGAGDSLTVASADGSISFHCATGNLGTGCTFTFLPAKNIIIQDRALEVETSMQDLSLNETDSFEMSFASSMKDKFYLQISKDGKVKMSGEKKVGF